MPKPQYRQQSKPQRRQQQMLGQMLNLEIPAEAVVAVTAVAAVGVAQALKKVVLVGLLVAGLKAA
jgi:hypothetical protein